MKADARRPKHERRMAKALYAEIRRAGYEGGYTRVAPQSVGLLILRDGYCGC